MSSSYECVGTVANQSAENSNYLTTEHILRYKRMRMNEEMQASLTVDVEKGKLH
jgi:hypothetical protein